MNAPPRSPWFSTVRARVNLAGFPASAAYVKVAPVKPGYYAVWWNDDDTVTHMLLGVARHGSLGEDIIKCVWGLAGNRWDPDSPPSEVTSNLPEPFHTELVESFAEAEDSE